MSPIWWAGDSRTVLFRRDQLGDENFAIFALDIASRATTALSPDRDVSADLVSVSSKHPSEVLIAHNQRTNVGRDLYRVSLSDGSSRLVLEDKSYFQVYADSSLTPRLATRFLKDASLELLRLSETDEQHLFTIPLEVAFTQFHLFGFSADGAFAWVRMPDERGMGALVAVEVSTGKKQTLWSGGEADVAQIITDVGEGRPHAVAVNRDRPRWTCLDDLFVQDFAVLDKATGSVEFQNQSDDDRYWSIRLASDVPLPRYVVYDRSARRVIDLRRSQETQTLYNGPAMETTIIPSRDGLSLVSYLTYPKDASVPAPLYLDVHGGPFYRDSFAGRFILPFHQHLADRGCAVLSVNYRGSVGFGRDFAAAGFREYGGKMHDDLIDAVRWAIDRGIADPKRVFIGGVSYGGYASLTAVALEPEMFVGAVSIAGISDLLAWMKPTSVPEYWRPFEVFRERAVGEAHTEDGRERLRRVSALHLADRIRAPLLIIHGQRDSRVLLHQAEDLVSLLAARGHPITYCVFPDEGHIPNRVVNRIAIAALIEEFVGRLGGLPIEPPEHDVDESSAVIKSYNWAKQTVP